MSYQLVKRGFYHDALSQQPKYTHKDWTQNNQLKSRISCDQQKLADRVICEAERVIDEVKETTSKFKKESDYRLEERVSHIAFTVDELREQKKLGEREQEILKVGLIDFHSSHSVMMNEYEKCINCQPPSLSVGYKKSHRVCNRKHQNGSISHM